MYVNEGDNIEYNCWMDFQDVSDVTGVDVHGFTDLMHPYLSLHDGDMVVHGTENSAITRADSASLSTVM